MNSPRQQTGYKQSQYERPNQKWELYNLAGDLAESKNLANKHPAELARLKAEFQAWQADLKRGPARRSNR